MSKNKIFIGADNAVEIIFGGVDLTLYTKVEATFGSDTRDSSANPDDVIIVNSTTLHLKFGDTAETTSNYWTIKGFINATDYDLLTSKCADNLGATTICQ